MMAQKLNSKYLEQVSTLIDIIPFIASDQKFALKGGTAINMFLLDMPRLSIDIDLCYLPLAPRDQALREIGEFVKSLSLKINSLGFKTTEKRTLDGYESALFISSKTADVKVEINLVVRGCVYKPILRPLVETAKSTFKRDAEILCLDSNDLFAGKICAALDRQHPRDFFDLYMFLEKFPYTRELHLAFMIYLLSSRRPISELIKPHLLNIKSLYERQFEGMTSLGVDCEALERTRIQIFELTYVSFTDQDKEFLLSFKRGEPQWDLLPIENAQYFPAIKWKQHNIRGMNADKRLQAFNTLVSKLEVRV